MLSCVENYRRGLHKKGLQNHSVHAKPDQPKSLPDIGVLEIRLVCLIFPVFLVENCDFCFLWDFFPADKHPCHPQWCFREKTCIVGFVKLTSKYFPALNYLFWLITKNKWGQFENPRFKRNTLWASILGKYPVLTLLSMTLAWIFLVEFSMWKKIHLHSFLLSLCASHCPHVCLELSFLKHFYLLFKYLQSLEEQKKLQAFWKHRRTP